MEQEFLIRFSDCDNDVLRARVIGVRTLSSTVGYWQAIAEQLAQRRPSGLLLIDELKGEELSASEWKALVLRMKGRGLEGVFIAHVKPFALDQIMYCEISAVAAGLQARVFRDEVEAMQWLVGTE
ncbi:MAG: hypothetical protein ACREO4_00245 [Lysobacter sp.]